MLNRGARLGHYELLELIGAGGMGEVYRARDEHLARDVALKVLPAGTLADEHARRRFRKEAEALAHLNHPHIATVHDFDTQGEVDFLVMEHVEGTTLAEKLKAGPLPEKELAGVGVQVAEALSEAHEQGVVHRDLKPGNLKLTPKGQVKILDFGLAKLLRPLSEATTESFTESHLLAGTLPYMSPEHLQGEAVDARSDLYSFGVVLYELATGRRPFEQKVSTALSDAILHQPAPSPARLKPDLSPRLEEIILKCLEKDAENRYQSARELAVDLRRLAMPTSEISPRQVPGGSARLMLQVGGAVLGVAAVVLGVLLGLNVGGLRERLFGRLAAPQIESIAVLPLDNLSGDPGQEYFADGMTEELITQLAQIGALRVTSRTSVMPYKEKKKSVPDIARELSVDWLVEGSVRQAAGRVRVTAQLIDARTDRHLWAENFERELHDVLVLQSDIARAIAAQIRVRLSPREEARLSRPRPVNPAAHEAYLRGITEDDPEKAKSYFEQAIQLDPQYAPPYAELAFVYDFVGFVGAMPPQQANAQMRQAAQKALERDDMLGEAHGALAMSKVNDWDWAGAEREFQRALELNPSQAFVRHMYAHFLMVRNRREEMLAETQRAVQLNPFSLALGSCLAWHCLYAGQYPQAIAAAQKILQRKPDFWWALMNLGYAYAQVGRYQEAVGTFEKSLRVWPNFPMALAGMAHAYALAGQRSDAERILKQLTEQAKSSYVPAYHIATVYAGLGEAEEAFTWLDEAYQERSALLVDVGWDPKFASLRSDPRFQNLLRRMNFPE